MSNMFNGIQDGSVIRVKFKSIPELTKARNMAQTIRYLDTYDIGSNVNAIVLGGDFIVVSVDGISEKEPYIEIDNHHDGGTMTIYPEIIESLEVIDIANKFTSEEHGICMIQVDDKIYINGELLWDGEPGWDAADQGKLTAFTKFMEQFLVAKAFEGSLSNDGEE